MTREEYGLMQKIFKRYWHHQEGDVGPGSSSISPPCTGKKEIEFICLQDMIDDKEWKEDEERFYEVILEEDQFLEEGHTQRSEDRLFT